MKLFKALDLYISILIVFLLTAFAEALLQAICEPLPAGNRALLLAFLVALFLGVYFCRLRASQCSFR